MNARTTVIALSVLTLALAGCVPAPDEAGSFGSKAPRAWFDAPIPGSVFYPPNPCQIVGHGASPAGIQAFELTINGTAVSLPSPDTQASLVTLTRDCALTEPGLYSLFLRAEDNAGNWSGFAETYLTIAGSEALAAPQNAPAAAATLTQSVPPPPPAAGVPANVAIQSVSTWVAFVGDTSCGPVETIITAHATAPKGIAAVILFYRFGPGNFESISMDPIGEDLYRGTLNMNSIFGGTIPFESAIPDYQVVVQQGDGDTSLRTPVLADIEVKACGSAPPPPGGADACAAYVDQRACQANGCNWWEIAGTPPTFVCKSKP